MTVTELPHSSSNVQLAATEVQTIFGWSANQLVRPPAPNGGTWDPTSNDGWYSDDHSHFRSAESILRLTVHQLGDDFQSRRIKLVANPEVAASLRASNLYRFEQVLDYVAGSDSRGDYVDIPLGEDASTGTSNETWSSAWHRKYHLDAVRVRPTCKGMAIELV